MSTSRYDPAPFGAHATEDANAHLTVSVVIPTRGRPALVTRAVESALAQSRSPDEVVVVVDGPDPETVRAIASLQHPRVRTLELTSNVGAAAARNAGIKACTSDLVAFLDDDDEWLPAKLDEQVAQWAAHPERRRLLLGTAVEWRSGSVVNIWPTRRPNTDEPVGDYLFVRRRPGEGLLPTPTLLLPRALAVRHPFPTTLRVHEDWDWLLTLQEGGAVVDVLLRPLTIVHAPPVRASLSRQASWETSLEWARLRRSTLGPRAFSAFCLTEVARSARRQGGAKAFATVLAAALLGRPRAYDLLRYVYIWAAPEGVRWRLASLAR